MSEILVNSLNASWPWLCSILGLVLLLRILIHFARCRPSLAHLAKLHGDEQGGVQTLSFVLTVPLFIFIMMFIVQLSQLTIGQVAVEHAAYSAARSAIVWLPSRAASEFDGSVWELENQMGGPRQFPIGLEGNGTSGSNGQSVAYDASQFRLTGQTPDNASKLAFVYQIPATGPKYEKVRLAAAMACMSVSPSRQVVSSPTQNSTPAMTLLTPMLNAYLQIAPSSSANGRIPSRLQNKLIYALENTYVKIEVRHKDTEPFVDPDLSNGRSPRNFYGWQDSVTVEVIHDFALLPGPGRLMARRATAPPGTSVADSYANGEQKDRIASSLTEKYPGTYVYPLFARARMTNEGFVPHFAYSTPLQNSGSN